MVDGEYINKPCACGKLSIEECKIGCCLDSDTGRKIKILERNNRNIPSTIEFHYAGQWLRFKRINRVKNYVPKPKGKTTNHFNTGSNG